MSPPRSTAPPAPGPGEATVDYYTVPEAAAFLQVSRTTIWRWIAAGRLPAYRAGPRTTRIKQADLEAALAPVEPAYGTVPRSDQPLARRDAAVRVAPEIMVRRLTAADAEIALEVLRERDELLRRLLQSFPDGSVSVLDHELRFVLVEGQGLQTLGLSSEALVGRHWAEVFPPEVGDTVGPQLEQVLEGSSATFETVVGDQILSIHLAPLLDRQGRVYAIVAVTTNVTARRRAEEERARLAFLAEASAELYDSLDHEATLGRITDLLVRFLADWCVVDLVDDEVEIRQVAVAHTNPAKADLVRELRFRYPPDLNRPYGLTKVLRTGSSVLYPEIRDEWRVAAARDAEHLRLMRELAARSSMTVPLRLRGRILGALTLVSAESGRIYTETDLALATDVAGRCALAVENARLYGELQETLRTREVFLTTLVHDLKNPLTASRGYAQILYRQVRKLGDAELAERLAQCAAKIDSNGAKMGALLDELLDNARLEAGQPLTLRRTLTNLVELVQQTVADHQLAAPNHRLEVATSESKLIGDWDPARIERVLDNLLNNAIKYSPDGGLVTLRVEREADMAVLSVQDQGLGIPAADLERVFERFQRGGNVANRVRGTGIGLSGVRQVVEQHGGSIGLESDEGVGTTVTVRLPLD